MSTWTVLWLAWGFVFVVVETLAIIDRRRGDTLSEHVWKWLKVGARQPTLLVWVARAGVLIFCAWLGFHLAFGWF